MKRVACFLLCLAFLGLLGFGCTNGGGSGDIDESGGKGPEQVSTTAPSTPKNNPPIVNAGDDQAGIRGAKIQLDGAKSSDPDADKLTFEWKITQTPAGGDAVLGDATTLKPYFIIPQGVTTTPDVYVIKLTASDGKAEPVSDEVRVSVNNAVPVIEKVEFLSPEPVALVDQLDIRSSGSAQLKVLAKDPDKAPQPLTYTWTVLPSSSNFLFEPGVTTIQDKDTVEIKAPNLVGSYAEIEVSAFDGLISSKKVITAQVWKDVQLVNGKLPYVNGAFVQNKAPAANCTSQGTTVCPFSSMDMAYAKRDEVDIYLMEGSYTLAEATDTNNRSIMGGYQLVDGKWRRPGYGFKGNKLYSNVTIKNSTNSLVEPAKANKLLEISGLDVKNTCAYNGTDPTETCIIRTKDVPLMIHFNRFNSSLKGEAGKIIHCAQVCGENSGKLTISHNEFTHSVTSPVSMFTSVSVKGNNLSEATINNNKFEYPKNMGVAVYVNGGEAAAVSRNIITDSSAPNTTLKTSAVVIEGTVMSHISANKVLPSKDRINTIGLYVSGNSTQTTYINGNLVVLGPDQNISEGIKVSNLTSAKIYNNTLVAQGDSSKASKDILLSCANVAGFYAVNNIFYIEPGNNSDEKRGIFFDENHCLPVRVRSNVFYDVTGLAGGSRHIMNKSNTITTLQELEIAFPHPTSGDNFSQDPGLNADYSLMENSQMINMGCKSSACSSGAPYLGGEIDIDGQSRPYPPFDRKDPNADPFANHDIGADEYIK